MVPPQVGSRRVVGCSPRVKGRNRSTRPARPASPVLAASATPASRPSVRRATRSSASRVRSRSESGSAASTLPGGRRATTGCGRVGATRRTSSQVSPSRRRAGGSSASCSRGSSRSSSSRTSSSRTAKTRSSRSARPAVARPGPLERGDELVDLLVLLLDAQRERLAVGQRPAHGRPQDGLLGEGVGEDEPADRGERLLLLLALALPRLLDQPVEPGVVGPLTLQDAGAATQLRDALVRDRPGHRRLLLLAAPRTLRRPDPCGLGSPLLLPGPSGDQTPRVRIEPVGARAAHLGRVVGSHATRARDGNNQPGGSA